MVKFMTPMRTLLGLLVIAPAVLIAQAQVGPVAPVSQRALVSIGATTNDELRAWDATIEAMLRTGQLVTVSTQDDPHVDGRRHENLIQFYQGIPVYGGSISRQITKSGTVSVFGTVYEGIAIDPVPALTGDGVVPALVDSFGGRLVGGAPQLVVFPYVDGRYRLAYRATMSNGKTHFVDADNGDVLFTFDDILAQSQVGTGTGALGDTKKISATQVTGGFRTQDQLRPAQIRTFDTRGSQTALTRLQSPPATAVDADYSLDTDNAWADAPVVDTHVHSGWMHDYLYKQHGWTGVDNRRGTITAVVHSALINNAYFALPPQGPEGRGLFVYGRTTGGSPVTTLDIVAHEMMHGVTTAAVSQRTGTPLLNTIVQDLGPSSFTSAGTEFQCATTVVVFGTLRLPMYCSAGRYVQVSNHGGALNESFSDVFGIAAEFFHQPPGTGTLRADYRIGEDLGVAELIRAADAPASIAALPSSLGPIAYPDHMSRTFRFLTAVLTGTPTNPGVILILPWVLVGNQLATLPTTDSVGVHVNATVVSHAFYLAVEGGRNATSGITVQGVGSGNRAQIERAFFRGMTVLMPNGPTMPLAAATVHQAAVDLYGANSAPATAVRQAMQAVGLMP